jgi:ABC-2 type transport system permease protein
MHKVLAVARAYTLSILTYRTRTLVSLLSVVVAVIPVYFIAGLLQPIAATAIAGESTEYFTYLVVGSIASFVMAEALSVTPTMINSYINSGTLEQLFTTPIRWPALLSGLSLYGVGWVAIRSLVLLTVAWVWATSTIAWARGLEFAAIMLLLGLAYFGVGLIAGALVLVIRTPLFLPQAVAGASALIGTVYFPASALPLGLAPFANAVPTTPALRAARQILLRDQALTNVLPDIGIVVLWAVGALMIGSLCFHAALQYARRTGTLTQY